MASTYLDMASANAIMKELYDGQGVPDLVFKDNPVLALMPKDTEFGGKYKPIPLKYANGQGRSSNFATAQANQSPNKYQEFLITTVSDYQLGTIDHKTMLSARKDKMAFLNTVTAVVDGCFSNITLSLASSILRSGTGSIGKIAAGGITTGVITLDDIETVTQFQQDMVLQANATDGGATPRAALGYVIAVDYDAGTITVSTTMGGAAASPGSWAAGDYLLVQGDNNAKISGIPAWIPATAPSGTDNFFGVNRSTSTLLSGVRFNGSSYSMTEALVKASSKVGRVGGAPKHCVVSFDGFAALELDLGAKVQYTDLKGPAELAFRGIKIHGHKSDIEVFPDRNCPSKTGYMLQMDTWCLESIEDAPMVLKYQDGLEFLRVGNADAAELRVGYYAQVRTNAPAYNANITLPA